MIDKVEGGSFVKRETDESIMVEFWEDSIEERNAERRRRAHIYDIMNENNCE